MIGTIAFLAKSGNAELGCHNEVHPDGHRDRIPRIQFLGLHIPNLKLLYNEHKGSTALRSLIVKDHDNLTHEDVLIPSGAAGALFIISSSQLAPTDHLVVVRPNYATNLETPRAIGCGITITTPHNPTGTVVNRGTLDRLVSLTNERGIILLVDETYADIAYQGRLPIAASLGDHVISVSSLSKSYGIPGIRLGWIINKNPKLQETFLAAKEQISISGSVIDEWIAEQVLSRKHEILSAKEMDQRRKIVAEWIQKEGELVEWVKPEGGVVCFPRLKKGSAGGLDAFYHRLLHKYGTYVGLGHWFEQSDAFMRIGYG
ncbi:aspartate aminotransferase [Aspergillus nomiae NRRL 13137]|uniref:Aspartate aminotransferase n=1 Tax=Aspergillus nomiae NRRL (strain ATCC 15546 / NRRL 13137 / CBS 260.88 / M93) TaxID=1509407 RepID=A0A0L1JAS8_ASPN3|nr:aspartate aminotransferase [Aspergillus nomiae NRRL 13137]KNG88822.1 aspartate aminotransferase [Aspergillus nomiae NRRL 13137]